MFINNVEKTPIINNYYLTRNLTIMNNISFLSQAINYIYLMVFMRNYCKKWTFITFTFGILVVIFIGM